MKGELTCPDCASVHDHPYRWCQDCEAVMNGGDINLWVPRAFSEANKHGYTQAQLHRENVEGAKRQGKDLERVSRS